jgi:hypothetical protein
MTLITCAVDVNVPKDSVAIRLVESIEPHNSSEDFIARRV